MIVIVLFLMILTLLGCVPMAYEITLEQSRSVAWCWVVNLSWAFGLLEWEAQKEGGKDWTISLAFLKGLYRVQKKKRHLNLFRSDKTEKNIGLREKWQQAKTLLENIEPYSLTVKYSCESPYGTGLAMAWASMLFPLIVPCCGHQNHISLEPKFAEFSPQKKIVISGKMLTIRFCYIAFKWLVKGAFKSFR